MRMSDFSSEYDLADLPTVSGSPMQNTVLGTHTDAMNPGLRTEESLVNLLREAVYLFYFAKEACPALVAAANGATGPVKPATEVVNIVLLKQAVLGIATTIDLTAPRAKGSVPTTGRTLSLPHAIDALDRELTSRLATNPDDETAAAADLLRHIKSSTNADTVLSLKYVRHLRNKWAGHATLDRAFDSWANADAEVNFALLEDAVARMVNAYQDLGTLASMSEDLRAVEAGGRASTKHPDGTATVRMGIAWSGANALAMVMREQAKKHAVAFVAALAEV